MTHVTIERRRQPRFSRPRIATLLFLLAFVLIVLSAASLVFVGFVASRAADDQAAANETRLFDNALRDRMLLIARDQLSVARWDRAVLNVVLNFDKAYVRDELVDSLWYDYGHERTFFIGPGARVLAAALRDQVDFSARALAPGDDLHALVAEAIARFEAHRVAIPGGYGAKMVPRTRIEDIAALGFATVDERPALVSAMAIVPDDGTVALPEGPPVVLVSAKFIDTELTADLNAQLDFRNLAFAPAPIAAAAAASRRPRGSATAAQTAPVMTHHGDPAAARAVYTSDGALLGWFGWSSERPGDRIWSMIIPLIILLGGVLAAAAFAVARQIGRLTGRLEMSERRNRHLARHDPLTGLANRLQFDAELDEALAALPQPFAVIACDLDRFKAVNDTFGHAAGDAVIRAVASRLRHVVGAAGLVGRTGGDEFVILLTGFADRPRLTVLSRQIIDAVSAPVALADGTTDVGISLGVAVAPDCGADAVALMAAADAALYRAKEAGRGRTIFAEGPTAPQACGSDEAARDRLLG